jgi:hypothetical protein
VTGPPAVNRTTDGKVLLTKTRKVNNPAATALRLGAQSLHRSPSVLGDYYPDTTGLNRGWAEGGAGRQGAGWGRAVNRPGLEGRCLDRA